MLPGGVHWWGIRGAASPDWGAGEPGVPSRKGQWGIGGVPAVLAGPGRGVLLKHGDGTFQLVLLVKDTIQALTRRDFGV